ncbi:hypothetical protein HOH45_09275 [bacterium]|nr:hypothetical protein [bacterium]
MGRKRSLFSLNSRRNTTKKAHALKTEIKEKEHFSQLKTYCLGAISNELNPPLTHVKHTISNLIAGTVSSFTDSQSNLINIAYKNIEKMERTIKNISTLSRLSSPEFAVDKKQLNIVSLIHESLESLATLPIYTEP